MYFLTAMMTQTRDTYIKILLFLTIFAIYSGNICPTVFVGDSGELTTTAYTLGIAHPSGYPTYLLLLKAFMFLPLDNIAAKANLFSSMCFALAISLLYQFFRHLKIPAIWVTLSLLVMALTRVFWEEATVARVYGLNLLFLVVLLRLAVTSQSKPKHIPITALICGLSLGNHLQILFTILPCIIIIICKQWKNIQLKAIISAIIIFILSLSVYLYLPIRSVQDPAMDWENPETYENMYQSLTRANYWNKGTHLEAGAVKEEITTFPKRIIRQCGVPIAVLSGCGLIFLIFQSPLTALVLGITGLANIFFLLLHGSNYDLFLTDRYHIPIVFFIACGFVFFISFIQRITPSRFYRPIIVLILCTLITHTFFRHYIYCNRQDIFTADDFGFNIETLLPADACFFVLGDGSSFSLAYRHYVTNSRRDITLIHRTVNLFHTPSMLPKLYYDNSTQRANIEQDIIEHFRYNAFSTSLSNMDNMTETAAIPFGFVFKFVPNNWRFQQPQVRYIYFRNHPVPAVFLENRMIELIHNVYKAGASQRWNLQNSLNEVNIIRAKIKEDTASIKDIDKLKQLYLSSNLHRSAHFVDTYLSSKQITDQ